MSNPPSPAAFGEKFRNEFMIYFVAWRTLPSSCSGSGCSIIYSHFTREREDNSKMCHTSKADMFP